LLNTKSRKELLDVFGAEIDMKLSNLDRTNQRLLSVAVVTDPNATGHDRPTEPVPLLGRAREDVD